MRRYLCNALPYALTCLEAKLHVCRVLTVVTSAYQAAVHDPAARYRVSKGILKEARTVWSQSKGMEV